MAEPEREPAYRVGAKRAPLDVLQVLTLGATSMAFYVMARRGLSLAYGEATVLAAHQAIELLIKVVILQHDLNGSEQHRLASSMHKHRSKIRHFDTVLRDVDTEIFLDELSDAYKYVRYGERGSSRGNDFIHRLDELVRGLWDEYQRTLKTTGMQFYVHQG